MRFAEKGGATAVLFCENDLVEEGDGGVGSGFILAEVDKFVEGCKSVSVEVCGRIPDKRKETSKPGEEEGKDDHILINRPCVCCSIATYSAFSLGKLLKNPSTLNRCNIPAFFCSPVTGCRYFR